MSQAHAAAPAAHGSHDTHAVADRDFGSASNGKIAMWIFLVTDGLTFAGLLLGYGYLRLQEPEWPDPARLLGITLTGVATFILIVSSLFMVLSLAAAHENKRGAMLGWLAATAFGGMAFLGIQVYEYSHLVHGNGMTLWGWTQAGHGLDAAWERAHRVSPDNFASTFYVITGFHGLHVTTGVIYLWTMFFKGAKQKTITPHYYNLLEISGLFWHFVDLVWILVFTFIYLI